MTSLGVRRPATALSLVAVVPGVAAAQPVDVATLDGLPGTVKAAGSFLLVAAFGVLYLRRAEPRVHRALDALLDRPYSAVPYGLFGYVLALAVGLYGLSQLGRIGVANTRLGQLLALLLVCAVVALTAFGFLVVGTLVTDVRGRRRPTYGLAVGAVLSAVGWLVLPTVGGLAVWVLVAAFGLGGAVRRWFHAERTVEAERAE
ncbi:hypothetical protein [Haloarcula litorea]|uniref:hypothetical protein n=1 Tax=Haloarcula litorea TaxID=3032579 RepID=UPI0023E7FF13|nr:hypothetical protein [Halomicroarcula sp. GDY20]